MSEILTGQNIQYYVVPLNTNNDNVDSSVIENSLNNLKTQLPKNCILLTELPDHYQMYIIDNLGNNKPIKYPITDLNSINEQISKYNNIFENKLSEFTTTVTNQITNDTIDKVNHNSDDISYLTSQIQYLGKDISYINTKISDIESDIKTNNSSNSGSSSSSSNQIIYSDIIDLKTKITYLQNRLEDTYNYVFNNLENRMRLLESYVTTYGFQVTPYS